MNDDSMAVPPELQHLLEKRSAADRRKKQRRAADLGPIGSIESAESLDEVNFAERRKADRRKSQRRASRKPSR